jgi:protein transport protein SEC13
VEASPAGLDRLEHERAFFVHRYANIYSGDWTATTLNFDAVAWRVSWSLSGNVLAVSTGDNKVSLWKERLSGGWEMVKTIDE